jgi:hypothetical protein
VPLQIAVLVFWLIETDAERPEFGFTVIRTVSLIVQPEVVELTIYCVVVVGVATGFAMVELLNPATGDHV